jgi:hypothetical protein
LHHCLCQPGWWPLLLKPWRVTAETKRPCSPGTLSIREITLSHLHAQSTVAGMATIVCRWNGTGMHLDTTRAVLPVVIPVRHNQHRARPVFGAPVVPKVGFCWSRMPRTLGSAGYSCTSSQMSSQESSFANANKTRRLVLLLTSCTP